MEFIIIILGKEILWLEQKTTGISCGMLITLYLSKLSLNLTNALQISRLKKVFANDLKSNIQNILILLYFACHIPQFKMLIMPFP